MMVTQRKNSVDDEKRLSERIERKFYVVPKNIGMAYGLLRHICKLDSEYPSEQINSLYFDTSDLEQHERSLSGEFRKDKIRIRWYGNDIDLSKTQNIFIELKSRDGFTGTKQRRMFSVESGNLQFPHIYEGIVSRHILNDTLAGFKYFPNKPLCPVIKISYWRYRFTDRITGQRVSLDCHIRSTMVMEGLGYGEHDVELAGAVIEVKGTSLELPPTLSRMKFLDIDWSRFSKYSGCIDIHMEKPGTFSRLWPSGRLFQ